MLDVATRFPMMCRRKRMLKWDDIHQDMMKRNIENDKRKRKHMTKNISRRARTLRRRARAALREAARRPATRTFRLTRKGVEVREPQRAFEVIHSCAQGQALVTEDSRAAFTRAHAHMFERPCSMDRCDTHHSRSFRSILRRRERRPRGAPLRPVGMVCRWRGSGLLAKSPTRS